MLFFILLFNFDLCVAFNPNKSHFNHKSLVFMAHTFIKVNGCLCLFFSTGRVSRRKKIIQSQIHVKEKNNRAFLRS